MLFIRWTATIDRPVWVVWGAVDVCIQSGAVGTGKLGAHFFFLCLACFSALTTGTTYFLISLLWCMTACLRITLGTRCDVIMYTTGCELRAPIYLMCIHTTNVVWWPVDAVLFLHTFPSRYSVHELKYELRDTHVRAAHEFICSLRLPDLLLLASAYTPHTHNIR